jgi:CRP-like cAMP-binding protein
MTPAEVQKYLETLVVPVLTEALADMCLQKPHDPFKWLASYLLEHNPRGSTKLEFADAIVSILKTGDYFGEIALLTNKPRQVTVRCKSDCVLLMLDRSSFNRLCGPLFELMKRNIDSYQKFASSLLEAGQSDAADVASAALAPHLEDDLQDDQQPIAPDATAAAAAAAASSKRRTAGRSKAVFVAPLEVDAGWSAPVFEKSEQQKSELNELLQKSVLLKNLDAAAKTTVVNALQSREVGNGTNIITQGEAGDLFYILGLGTARAFVKKGDEEPKSVKDYVPGDTFGELALLHGEPRAATITATSDCLVWGLDRDTFRRIMMQVSSWSRLLVVTFLQSFIEYCAVSSCLIVVIHSFISRRLAPRSHLSETDSLKRFPFSPHWTNTSVSKLQRHSFSKRSRPSFVPWLFPQLAISCCCLPLICPQLQSRGDGPSRGRHWQRILHRQIRFVLLLFFLLCHQRVPHGLPPNLILTSPFPIIFIALTPNDQGRSSAPRRSFEFSSLAHVCEVSLIKSAVPSLLRCG